MRKWDGTTVERALVRNSLALTIANTKEASVYQLIAALHVAILIYYHLHATVLLMSTACRHPSCAWILVLCDASRNDALVFFVYALYSHVNPGAIFSSLR